jgi:hypothetical protein
MFYQDKRSGKKTTSAVHAAYEFLKQHLKKGTVRKVIYQRMAD